MHLPTPMEIQKREYIYGKDVKFVCWLLSICAVMVIQLST